MVTKYIERKRLITISDNQVIYDTMTDTMRGAIVGAVISTLGALGIHYLGYFHTEDDIEKQFVTILSESFEAVDETMTFQESVESLNVYVQSLTEENSSLKKELEDKNTDLASETKQISLFHLTPLQEENVDLYSDSYLTDNLGTMYSDGIGFYTNGFAEYTNLDDYVKLTGTLVVSEWGKNRNFEGIFCIYNAESMEKLCGDVIITKGMEPYKIDCDISDARKIRIDFSITESYDQYVVFFVEPKLELESAD